MCFSRSFWAVGAVLAALAMGGCGHALQPDYLWPTGSTADPLRSPTAGPGTPQSRRRGTVSAIHGQDDVFDGLEQRGTGSFVARSGFSNVAVVEPTPTGGEGITLNLLNVPIAQAAKSVLGDILKVNYSIADKVAGAVTIQTATPMHRDGVVSVFESALKASGAALVRAADGAYRIVPAINAAQSGARFAGQRPSGPGTQLRVVTLRHVAPSEMRRIIEPISQQGAVASTDDARNLLVLSATAQDIAEIERLIATFDVDWMRGMSFAFYPVKSSDPEAIARELETVLGLDAGGPMKGTIRVLPNRRLSAIMVIASRPGALDTARKWVRQLDKVAETTEEQLFVYKIKNRNAAELANILGRVLGTRDGAQQATGSVAPRFDSATVASEPAAADPAARSSAAAGPVVPPIVAMLPGGLPVGAAPVAITPAQSLGIPAVAPAATAASLDPGRSGAPAGAPTQPSGSAAAPRMQKVVADEANSALLITATRKEYDRIVQILDRLDTLPVQVMLEAMIVEVGLNDQLKFGVKWAFGRPTNNATLSDVATGVVASQFPGFSYFFTGRDLTTAIDALSSITRVNIVSAPSLMVLDNKKAALQVGDQVPIVTQTAQNVIVPGGPIVNSIVMKDTGIILNVTPRVSDNGRVVLEIEQEVSSVAKTTTSGIDSPTISQRRLRTTVAVADGEVVALGGLIQERDNKVKTGVPIISDVPVLGALFRQKDDKIDRTELLVFIRPLVVRDNHEARYVTDEFRRRIHLESPASTRGRNIYDRDAARILH